MGVCAIEDRAVQVAFYAPPGSVAVTVAPHPAVPSRAAGTGRADGSHRTVQHPGGPGLVLLEGLAPATAITVELAFDGASPMRRSTRTLPSPPGALLSRVTTISDLHLGSTRHGMLNTMFDRSGLADPPPVRCARGALVDAAAWQPDLLVAKGDLTQSGLAAEWRLLGRLLDAHAAGVARLGVPGNHDKKERRDVDAFEGLALAGFTAAPLQWLDLDGARVIGIDSAVPSAGPGRLGPLAEDAVELAADAARSGRAVLVCLHHPLERAPFRTQYPKGVPWAEGRRFARQLARANPHGLITSGHTHRNRRRSLGPLVHTEVGSTKDWPGVWAGYAIHEGGIRQLVRRVSDVEAIGWIHYSRWAAAGLWWPYAPGRMDDRCFTHPWPQAHRGR